MKTTKENLIILLLLLLLAVLPLVTSALLSWPFIQAFVIRQIIIYFFILVEIMVLLLILKLQILK